MRRGPLGRGALLSGLRGDSSRIGADHLPGGREDSTATANYVRTEEEKARATWTKPPPQVGSNGMSPTVQVDGKTRSWFEVIDGTGEGWLAAIAQCA